MPRSVAEILDETYRRSADSAGYMAELRDTDDLYYGRLDIGVPELTAKNKRVEVANLAMQGIDQHGMRIASTLPDMVWPAVRASSSASVGKADRRRQAMFGLWEENAVDLRLHYQARHLISYARSVTQLRPRRLRRGDPRWKSGNGWTVDYVLRTPHETLPAGSSNPLDVVPENCIFRYHQSMVWLDRNYPEAMSVVRQVRAATQSPMAKPGDTASVELVEFVSDEETVLIATGSCDNPNLPREASYGLATITHLGGDWGARDGKVWGVQLDRYPNRAGAPNTIVPQRITLGGELQGQFAQMVGLYLQAAKLMALELNAVTRAVFPDTYLEDSDPTVPATIEVADGMRGKIGRVHGGKLNVIQLSPGFQTYPTIDRLTEAQRQAGLVPADFGGYSASNIRTGKRGADIMASTVDFSIQEAQLLFQRSLKAENEIAVEIAKAYFKGERKSYVVGWPGAKGQVEYRPEEIFEDAAAHRVEYPMVGSDANMLGVQLAQANGAGLMSDETARRKHPLIDDADFEGRQVVIEAWGKGLREGMAQQIAGGAFPPADAAHLIQLVQGGMAEWDAVAQVHDEMQQRQASSGPPGAPDGAVAPGSPDAQPGMAQPGAGAEAGVLGPPPPPALSPLAGLMGALRHTSNPVRVAP